MAKNQIIRGKALRPNAGIQAWYVKQLTSFTRRMCEACQEYILKLLRTQRKTAQDASPASQRRILLNRLNREFEDLFAKKAKEIAESMLRRQNRYANTSVKASVASLAGQTAAAQFTPDIPLYSRALREIMKTALYANVSYIKSIQSKYFTDITGAVSRAVLDEEGLASLAKNLTRYKGINERRARNIAKDQCKKAYEAISYQKMADAGIEKWEWVHGGGTKTVRLNHIRDVKDGGLNHSIHNMGEKVWDKEAWREKGGKFRGDYIEPGQLPFCSCFRRPVITIGA